MTMRTSLLTLRPMIMTIMKVFLGLPIGALHGITVTVPTVLCLLGRQGCQHKYPLTALHQNHQRLPRPPQQVYQHTNRLLNLHPTQLALQPLCQVPARHPNHHHSQLQDQQATLRQFLFLLQVLNQLHYRLHHLRHCQHLSQHQSQLRCQPLVQPLIHQQHQHLHQHHSLHIFQLLLQLGIPLICRQQPPLTFPQHCLPMCLHPNQPQPQPLSQLHHQQQSQPFPPLNSQPSLHQRTPVHCPLRVHHTSLPPHQQRSHPLILQHSPL
mmetsp:Transcript_6259/g.7646  ORF Transcript_6259/g.7646 Transcript_6259/m.7646 type:complete len:267 (+) Transcript_6259:582-1382(+)